MAIHLDNVDDLPCVAHHAVEVRLCALSAVLDAYLDSARTEGKLAIADLGSVEYDTPWLAELIVKFGPPASWDLPGTAALNAVLATTRMLVLNDFIGSHYAAIPGGAAPLSAIPESPARDSFMSTISDYAMAFQKRTFS